MEASPLVKLPTELRLEIYDHLFRSSNSYRRPIKPNVRAPELLQPALAATCRELRQEVLPAFYASKTFIIDDQRKGIEAAERFLRRLGPHWTQQLTIRVPWSTTFMTFCGRRAFDRLVAERRVRGGKVEPEPWVQTMRCSWWTHRIKGSTVPHPSMEEEVLGQFLVGMGLTLTVYYLLEGRMSLAGSTFELPQVLVVVLELDP
ncbi:hypothetical protein K431DRAFT_295248 [Polychaeton citri CBS 116435]|uniref:F-box domain-containing protein n=1 Tax=Polychaeton citri CBS 116435 TaxID=1314669 RepID=A0A9P4Q6G9_9PEZI|nr:hypothetical protein K431DRAFT_295248 [Polychaeton citri CBS 116435]